MERRTLLLGGLLAAAAQVAPAAEPAPVDDPLLDELEKHPRCVICNMDRRRFHYARHLLHYGDGSVHGTCSIHCAAECMVAERRRGFRTIYAPDNGVAGEPKPLVEAAAASYLIGSNLPGVMTPVSKVPFASRDAALQAQQLHGGEVAGFARAVSASLEEMAIGVVRRYDNERERRRRQAAG